MTTVPVTESAARRGIGDILLGLGFVTEEELAGAGVEQERTGQPLGQILVEHGAITRLELASALAEQWSDQSASISLLPVPKPAPRPITQHDDDDQYAARLQDAVADLARRVQAEQPREGEDVRVTELAERLEANVARAQRIEATLATLADSLQGVTGGFEEALTGIQGAMAGLTLDLARVDSTVAEIVARPVGAAPQDPALTERLEELGAAVHALAERPLADPEARDRLDALAADLERFNESAQLDALRATLGEIERRVEELGTHDSVSEELESQRATLADLRSAVADLAARPESSPELDERLARIEAGLSDGIAASAPAGAVEALAGRVDAAIAQQHGLAESVEALQDRLKKPAKLVAELAERVDELVRERDAQMSLASRVEALEVPAPAPEPDPRIDGLGGELAALREELSNRATVTPADLEPLEHRLSQLAEHVEQLGREHEAHSSLADRVAVLEVPVPAPEDDPRLGQLAEQLDGLREGLSRRDAAIPPDPVPDPRIEQLGDELATLRQELSQRVAAATSEFDPALGHELSHLAERVEQLARDSKEQSSLTAELHDLEGRLRAEIVTPELLAEALDRTREELRPPVPEPDPRIDGLAHDIAALRDEISRPTEAPVADPHVGAALETLLARLESVENRLATDFATPAALAQAVDEVRAEVAGGAAPPLPPPDASALEHAVEVLAERLATVESLATRVDGLAEAVATAPEPAATPVLEDLRQDIEARVAHHVTGLKAALQHELESMLHDIEQPVRVDAGEPPDGFEDDMERTRMAIERLSLHLGEHDRALAEMMHGRGHQQKVDELAARIDELAAGGVVAPADTSAGGTASAGMRRDYADASDIRSLMRRLEGIEEETHEGRERLMNRLERMASSIDWRLQRLETGDPSGGGGAS